MAVKKRKLKPMTLRPVMPKVSSRPLFGKPQPVGNILPKKPDYSLQGTSLSGSWGSLSGIKRKKKLI